MSSRGLEIGAEAETQTFDDARVRYGVLEERYFVQPGRFAGIVGGFRCPSDVPQSVPSPVGHEHLVVFYTVLYCIRSVIRGPAFMRPSAHFSTCYLPHITTDHTTLLA